MLRNRVIPVLLIKNQGLVKTTNFKNPVYIGDPINAVKIFNEKEVDELILLDIEATNQKREPLFSKLEEIVSEAFMPIGYGGGINNLNQIEKLLKIGIEKVIINSASFNPKFIKQAAAHFGAQSIVVSVDVKKDIIGSNHLYTHSGTKKHKVDVSKSLQYFEQQGAGEIILNSIDRDGTMKGYDTKLLKSVSSTVNIPIVACGGAGKINDFREAIKAGASAVAAGSLFLFQGIYRAVLISYPKHSELESILNYNQ